MNKVKRTAILAGLVLLGVANAVPVNAAFPPPGRNTGVLPNPPIVDPPVVIPPVVIPPPVVIVCPPDPPMCATPEPATLTLAAMGLIGAVGAAKLRRKK